MKLQDFLKTCLRAGLRDFVPVMKLCFVPFLSIYLAISLIGQYFLEFTHAPYETLQMLGMAGSLMTGVLSSAVMALLVPVYIHNYRLGQPTDIGKHFKKWIGPVSIELLRAFAKVLMGFLLIIPGIIYSIHLYLVPYVVQFVPEYDQGKIDALKMSTEITKPHFAKFFLLLVIVGGLALVSQLSLQRFSLVSDPALYCVSFFFSAFLEIFTDIVLYTAFEQLLKLRETPQHVAHL